MEEGIRMRRNARSEVKVVIALLYNSAGRARLEMVVLLGQRSLG